MIDIAGVERRSGAATAAAPAPAMAARRPVDICMTGLKAAAEPMNARARAFVVNMLFGGARTPICALLFFQGAHFTIHCKFNT